MALFPIVILIFLFSQAALNTAYEHCEELKPNYDDSLKEFEKFGISVEDRRTRRDMSAVQEFIFRFKFFDRYYASVVISSNGVLYFDSFNAIFHQPPKPFPIYGKSKSIIAPFWSRMETDRAGEVLYGLRTDESSLKKIACDIHKSYPSFINFKPLYALVVTWYNMKPAESKLSKNKNNTFQAVLATNGLYSFVIFNYGKLNWPDSKETFISGYNLGEGDTYYAMTNVSSELYTSSNVGIPSKWIFRVDTKEKKIEKMVTFGTKMNDSLLEKSDESFHGPINLKKKIRITNNLTVSSLFVYANGFITFNQPFTLAYNSIPKKLPIDSIGMVFPFWSDINVLGNGDVYYRQITDEDSFNHIKRSINQPDFKPTWAFVATYYQVAPHTLAFGLNNTFQVILAAESNQSFYAIFIYEKINWPELSTKQPVESGFNLDSDHYYALSQKELSSNSNCNVPGIYVFKLNKPITRVEPDSLISPSQTEENSCIYSTWLTIVLNITIVYIICNLAWKLFSYFRTKTLQDFRVTRVLYRIRRDDSTATLNHSDIETLNN